MSGPDFTLPLATLLRESTHEAHDLVAKSPGAMVLLSGQLPRDEYVRYLMMLWHVYDAFERALDRHATHPALEPTHNPILLARAPALAEDISYLLQVPESSWKSHPAHQRLIASNPPQLSAYVSRINELAESADPTPLLAHSYVRYLGDLSGGQTIRRTLGKAYSLDEDLGLGLAFYDFKALRSAKQANQGEMKRIKEWFREGMNTAGDTSPTVKASVLAESNTAFDLNTDLFTTLDIDLTNDKDDQEESKEIPVLIEQAPQEKTYPLSQVLAVVAAICVAHFLLVTGGFFGARGYEKLVMVEDWVASFFQAGSD